MSETNFLPYGHQHIDQDDVDAVVKVLKSDFLTQGPVGPRLEQALAERVGAREAVVCATGTAALHLIALGLGLGPGDAWITSPLTFLATANAARYVGATPVFGDVDETGCLDSESIPGAVNRAQINGLTPKVIAAVDWTGQPADWAGLRRAAREFNLTLVDDGCHALGAQWDDDGRLINIGQGPAQATAFSFHPVKHITTGEGGAAITDDPDLAARMRMFRNHGMTRENLNYPDLALDSAGQPNPWYYEQQVVGYNYRLTDLQAALGLSQLTKLDRFLEKRRALARYYDRTVAELKNVRSLPQRPGNFSAYHLYVVLIDFSAAGMERGDLMNRLRRQGVGSQVHYIPIHLQPVYRTACGTKPGDCPKTEEMYQQILSLPLYPDMTEADVDRVVGLLADLTGGLT